jgi:hypothetical protein
MKTPGAEAVEATPRTQATHSLAPFAQPPRRLR